MKLAIVILNWNGKELLEQFLPSVIEHSQQATIYIADNASTDNSISFIKENYPQINIVQNCENFGYAGGYNMALTQVNADILCLLNSDVEVTQDWLNPILTEFKNNETTTIAQPKILDYKQKDSFEYAGAAGGFIDKYGYPYCRGRIFNTIEKDSGQYDEPSDIFWASGACFFIKKQVFDSLDGFDTSFFAHMEEIDLCWRAFNKGFIAKYIPNSKVYHVGGATLKNTNPQKTYLNFRNSLFTLTKNAPGNLFFLILIRLILDGVAALKFILEFKLQHALCILKAHFSYYASFNRLLKQRKTLTKRKKYYQKKSIVWSYFVFNRKVFNRL